MTYSGHIVNLFRAELHLEQCLPDSRTCPLKDLALHQKSETREFSKQCFQQGYSLTQPKQPTTNGSHLQSASACACILNANFSNLPWNANAVPLHKDENRRFSKASNTKVQHASYIPYSPWGAIVCVEYTSHVLHVGVLILHEAWARPMSWHLASTF